MESVKPVKIEVTGGDKSTRANYTTNELIFERDLNFLYGLALASSTGNEKIRERVQSAFDFCVYYMYKQSW